jgi:hypothetical protein
MVDFDGNKLLEPHLVGRPWSATSNSAGTSATHPAIAVNDLIPARTAAAHNVNMTVTG